MHSFYLDAIRSFEGFTPTATADYAQVSNGYGTKALYPGEVIDKAEAERRFHGEIDQARSIVEANAPHLDEGTKAALTSLTYNTGTAWVRSGLGDAVRRGDLQDVREIFQQYNKAGGQVLPGLVSRRSQEALWIGNPEIVASAAARQSPVVSAALADDVRSVSSGANVPTSTLAGPQLGAATSLPTLARSENAVLNELLRLAARHDGGEQTSGATGSSVGVSPVPRSLEALLAAHGVDVSILDNRSAIGDAFDAARFSQLSRAANLRANERPHQTNDRA